MNIIIEMNIIEIIMCANWEKYKGKIVYSLVSSAYFIDKSWGYGVPKAGIKLMGDIGHRHRIPVTYLITSKVAQDCKHLLTTFYKEYKDCVGLMLDFPDELDEKGQRIRGGKEIIEQMTLASLQGYIRNEINAIRTQLPWAEIKILGGGYRTEKVVQAAKAEGLIGLWGYCIFQIGTDDITDYGCPWGQFFISDQNYKAPSPDSSSLIGLEWTCRDISKAFHMAKSESYSTDPNDAESNGKCTNQNIEYWKDLFFQYHNNLKYNETVYFLQHQEAHEMEASEVCHGFNKWRIDYTADMLDRFCAFIAAQPDVICVTLNDACQSYLDRYQGITPPTYFFQRDIPILSLEWKQAVETNKADGSKHLWISFNEQMYDYVDEYVKQPKFHFNSPPWRDALFYFDQDCLLVFDKGIREPIWITDYCKKDGSRDEEFMWIPSPNIKKVIESVGATDNRLKIIYEIETKQSRPFGIMEWKNLAWDNYEIRETNAMYFKQFDYDGFFLRCDLKPGMNTIHIELNKHKDN
jgi:hypothetical protein